MANEKTPEGNNPKFKNVKEIEALVDDYFKWCDGTLLTDEETGLPILNKFGNPVYLDTHVPTITGLAYHLGFKSRKDLLRYAVKSKKAYTEAVNRAKMRVERYTEERLFDREGANGAKFALANNFEGWDAEQKRSVDENRTSAVQIICDIPRNTPTPVITVNADDATVEALPDKEETETDVRTDQAV